MREALTDQVCEDDHGVQRSALAASRKYCSKRSNSKRVHREAPKALIPADTVVCLSIRSLIGGNV